MLWAKRIIIGYLFLAIAGLQGCYSMKPVEGVEDRNNIIKAVKSNDVVAVETRQGQKMEFKVSEISDDKISGEGQEVNIDDIKEVKVERFSIGKSIAAIIGIGLVIGMIEIAKVLGI